MAVTDGEYVDLRPRWPLGEKDARAVQQSKGMKSKGLHTSLTELTKSELASLEGG